MKSMRLPGILGYVTIALWFLLMVLNAPTANAEDLGSANALDPTPDLVAVSVSDLLPSIENALYEKGVDPEATIALNKPQATLILQQGQEPVFQSVSLNRSNGRFLIRAAGAPGAPMIAISGAATTLIRLPVLADDIARDHVISEGDLVWSESSSARRSLFIGDMEEIIGKSARRALRAGSPLRKYDIATPLLVKKGDIVTMTVAGAGLRLSHSGVAMSSGGKGALIEIKNTKSDRIVKAIVTGKNRAEAPFRQSVVRNYSVTGASGLE